MPLVLICAAACACAWLLSGIVSRPNRWWYVLDDPNDRSLHQRPTPRTGGVAVLAGIIIGVLGLWWHSPAQEYLWLLTGLPVVLVCLWDDYRGAGVLSRLVMQCLSASLLLVVLNPWVVDWLPVAVQFALLFVAVVWMINLYNFMDGMDGFAGGMALIGFSTLALLGSLAGATDYSALSLVVAAASGGFLVWNFPPARLFLGDVGSAALGFLVAGMLLWGLRDGIVPISLGVLIFLPFIGDATVTLLRRLLRGERIWQAHREHYYQRLVRLGWGHRRTVVMEYRLMLGCSLSALGVQSQSPGWQWSMLALWVAVYAYLACRLSQLEASQQS